MLIPGQLHLWWPRLASCILSGRVGAGLGMTALGYGICPAGPECTSCTGLSSVQLSHSWGPGKTCRACGPETSLFPPVAGYTVTSVVSSRQGRVYVAGAPRFNHTGKAILFTMHNNRSLTIHQALRGEQVTKGEFSGEGGTEGVTNGESWAGGVSEPHRFPLSRTVPRPTHIFPGWGTSISFPPALERTVPSPESQALVPDAARRSWVLACLHFMNLCPNCQLLPGHV